MIGYALYIFIKVVETRQHTQTYVCQIVERTASLLPQDCIIKVLCLLVDSNRKAVIFQKMLEICQDYLANRFATFNFRMGFAQIRRIDRL